MNRRFAYHLLQTPGFLLALALLLLNDHLLKPTVGGVVTGKLSDLTGVFAFTIVLLSLRPRRPLLVAAGIALTFTLWKLPTSEPLITAWNDLGLFRIGRVVDLTDLIALLSIPLAFRYAARHPDPMRRRSPVLVPIVVITFVAFTATSCIPGYHYDKANYSIDGTPAEVEGALTSMVADSLLFSFYKTPERHVVMMLVEDPTLDANPIMITAEIVTIDWAEGSKMTLLFINDPNRACGPLKGCGSDGAYEKRKGLMQQAFEQRVVEGVRRRMGS